MPPEKKKLYQRLPDQQQLLLGIAPTQNLAQHISVASVKGSGPEWIYHRSIYYIYIYGYNINE